MKTNMNYIIINSKTFLKISNINNKIISLVLILFSIIIIVLIILTRFIIINILIILTLLQ